MDPVTAAKLWVIFRPIKLLKAIRAKRKGARMEINLGTRTSTNAAAGAGFLGTAYVQLAGLLPYPDLVAALTTPQMVVVVTTLIAWVVARITRTPDVPGKL